MPKRQSSGLEVEANLSFEDSFFRSPLTDINKQGIYFQVSH